LAYAFRPIFPRLIFIPPIQATHILPTEFDL
jgi:hypothetical protein